MADPVVLYANSFTNNDDQYTTDTDVDFTVDRPVLVMVGAAAATGNVGEPTLSTPSGIVFRTVFMWGLGGESPTPRAPWYLEAIPTQTISEPLTVSFPGGGNDIDECHITVIDRDTDHDILQIQASTQNTFETDMDSITMSPYENAGSGILLMGIKGSPRAIDTGVDGFTVLDETAGTIYGTHTLWKAANGGDLTPTASWIAGTDPDPSVHAVFVAFEIGTRTPGNIQPVKVPRGKWSSGAGATTATHAALRLRANHTYLVEVTNRIGSGTAGTVTPSTVGSVLTFTEVRTVNSPGVLRTTTWLVTVGSTDFVGVITFTASASHAVWGGMIHELGGADADSFVQSTPGQTTGSQASFTATFGVAPDAANEIIVVAGIISNTVAITVDATPAGYAIVENNPIASPSTMQQWAATLDGTDTAVVVNFSPNSNGAGMAIELAPAPAEEETITAEITNVLPALTQQATARAVVEAEIGNTLPALTQQATGERGPNLATVANTLPALEQSATGERGATEATVTNVLPALQSGAEARVTVTAAATNVLPALTQFATDADPGTPVDGLTEARVTNEHNDATVSSSRNEARVTSG